jgi:hypothetical protein
VTSGTSRPDPPVAEPVIAERVGAGLLLRTGQDEPDQLRDLLRLLPPEPGSCTVLVTADAGLSPDFPRALNSGLPEPRTPVRLVMLGPFPAEAGPADAARFLAEQLGVPVTVPVTPLVPGVLPGPRWMTGESGEDETGGPPWPEIPTVPPPVPAPLTESLLSLLVAGWPDESAAVSRPSSTRSDSTAEQVPAPTATVAVRAATPAPAAGRTKSAARPRHVDRRAWREADRAELRARLDGRYDAYVRVVTKTLAEEPGLRAGGMSPDLIAGLVAVRAYSDGDRDGVNRLLRVGEGDETAALLARGVTHGLRFLPTVLGPVFLPGTAGADVLAAYEPGRVLTDPGLLDARITPAEFPGATVQFVIWSVTARRLGRVGVEGPAAVLFPSASRFTVLAVDSPDSATPVPRVLLGDITVSSRGGPMGGRGERALTRMRAAVAPAGDTFPDHLPATPGLDATGHPYPEGSLDEP